MAEQPTIFISYATPDRQRVSEVYNFLIENGYNDTWIDFEKILPGQNWDFEIKRNLQKADIVIVFFSENSINKRGYVQREMNIVLKKLEEKLVDDIYIIPIKLDTHVEVPDLLSNLQWLDINSENSYKKLKESLEIQIQKLGLNTQVSYAFDEIDKIKIIKSTVEEKWDGLPGYEFEYTFPILSSDTYRNVNEITKLIEAKIIKTLHFYRRMKLDQEPQVYTWFQDKYRRMSTLDASYSNIYQSDNLISFHYTIHWYGAGAAHPNYYFETYNFFIDPLIEITSLMEVFDIQENTFDKLVILVREKLAEELIERISQNSEETKVELEESDMEWLISGTKDWNDLSCFTFSNQGITLYFAPYKISSYAMGAFSVDVIYKEIPVKISRIFQDALPIQMTYFEQ